MIALSTIFEDTGAKNCIRLLAPIMDDKSATTYINAFRNSAFETHGCKVTTIGDGMRDLTSHDIDAFHKAIADSEGTTLIELNAHGVFNGKHLIELGTDFIVPTIDLLTNALKHAENKRVVVISSACESGQLCKDSQQLPENISYLGLSDYNVSVRYDNQLSKILLFSQPIELTADNILKLSLTRNSDIIGRKTIPHLCTKQNNINLAELLESHSGIKFTDEEKSHITKSLSPFLNQPDQLPIIIQMIENREINESTQLSNTQLYDHALAIVYTSQQYRESLTPSLNISDEDDHPPAVLQIYQDLMHIRDHSLYHAYGKEVPRLLKLPIISFLAAMSANQHSEHPVVNSVVDIGVESTALTAMGLAIGNTPAAITLLASHLAEKGLNHFPSWDQIGKMSHKTPQERIAYSHMIEARATAELLAWPSKATETVSRYVKSVMDSVCVQINLGKNHSKYHSLANPSQFLPPSQLSGVQPAPAITLTKSAGLTLFASPPKSDHRLLDQPKLTQLPDFLSVKTARGALCKIHMPLPEQEIKSCVPTPLPKLTGLADETASKTGWDTLRSAKPDFTRTRFSLSKQPITAWDKLSRSSLPVNLSKSSTTTELNLFQLNTNPSPNFSLPGVSTFLLSEQRGSSVEISSSVSFFKPQLTHQSYVNAWDKLKEKGSFNVKGF
jgi:hypothetical protein